MKTFNKLIAVSTLTTLLAACGGGSSSDGGDTSTGGGDGGSTGGGNTGDSGYEVTTSVSGDGSVSKETTSVDEGGSVTLHMVSGEGNLLTSVEGCSGTLTGNRYTINDVQSDCSVDVVFEECTDCFAKADVITDYEPYFGLMARVCKRGPLLVTGSEDVSWDALCQAGDMLNTILEYNSDLALSMQENGSIVAVFSENENLCDLDYYSYLEGEALCEEAAGGQGGIPSNPVTACSEENILALASDPYKRGEESGENVCVHELAHTLMDVGLELDLVLEIEEHYDTALMDESIWRRSDGTDTFALTNARELFAEMVQSYFNANVNIDSFNHNGVNGSEELNDHDPIGYELVDRIFMQPADLK